MLLITSKIDSSPTQDPISFSDQLKQNNGTITILWARFKENLTKIGGQNPSQTLSSSAQSQFALDLVRASKTAMRLSLLDCIKTFGREAAIGEDKNLAYQLTRINPNLLSVSKEQLLSLVDQSHKELNNHLNTLYKKMVIWACLQPTIAGSEVESFYQIIILIRGVLTSQVKSGGDPTIPFLKSVIEQRTRWIVGSISPKDLDYKGRVRSALMKEQQQIFRQIPDMYYNTFLGAEHPKVQENLRQQNDKVQITPEDILTHIAHLQSRALEGALTEKSS